MLKIGLTGGIASGKTTAANFFTKLGAPVLDTDLLARELVKPGTDAFLQIVQRHGDNILTSEGTLNRRLLRKYIFENKLEKHWLENLLHPQIRICLQQRLAFIKGPYCILVIPLLLENHRAINVDRVLVIDTSFEVQIQRLAQRDQLSIAEAENTINQQLSRAERLVAADDIIYNDDSLSVQTLYDQIIQLHHFYSNFYSKNKIK